MKRTALLLALPILVACGRSEPPPFKVAGDMSIDDVCSAASYLVKKRLGKDYDTKKVVCSVKNIGVDNVEIRGGYGTPFNTLEYYVAHGVVFGDKLRLDTIQVAGIHAQPKPFLQFP